MKSRPQILEEEEEQLLKDDGTDICDQLMDRYKASTAPQQRHLLATAVALRSILTSESLPFTPTSYFLAALNNLSDIERLDTTAVSALLSFLGIVVPLITPKQGIKAEKVGDVVKVLVDVVDREGLGSASVKGVVKCLGALMVGFCDSEDWNMSKLGFHTLLKFSFDKRPKVRKSAQDCLEKVFKSFQSSSVIKEASKLIHSLFMSYMPLAVEVSHMKFANDPKDGMLSRPEHLELLHMLNVVKLTVPYLSMKVNLKILSELHKLILSEFSPLISHLLKIIEAFYEASKVEAIFSESQKIIASLAAYVLLLDKNPADTVIAAATLLKRTLDILHAAESRSWIMHIPLVFEALLGLLTSETSSTSPASVIMKQLINQHIEPKLLLVDETQSLDNMDHESEGACVIRSICNILEKSLSLCNDVPNDHILEVFSAIFRKLGKLSSIFMKDVIPRLADFMNLASGTASGSVHQVSCRPPTVVHVSRPSEIEDQRMDLPIVMMEQEIMEAINDNSSVIVCGETGCGKTTQVPQFLYEAGYGSKQSAEWSGIIGITQPRRVAVLATAKRVAFELGLRLGKQVGFQVRYDKRIGEDCSIKFMTDGILLREVQNDLLLKCYSVIILDEAHERSLNTDILIGFLSRVIRLRQDLYEKQQKVLLSGQIVRPENMIFPLKLVLMSATLRVEDFVVGKKLFSDPPPIIKVPTRQFPVNVHFSKKTEIVDYIGQSYKKILAIHKKLPPGGILVFVTGQREVELLCKQLRKASREHIVKSNKINSENNDTTVAEMNASEEEISMKEINEAFEGHENSTYEQTDRFSSFDEDQCDYHDDLDDSYSFETDSDLEYYGEDGNPVDLEKLNSDTISVLGEEMSLTSLKASFEDLAWKNALESGSVPVMLEASSECSKHTVKLKYGDTGGNNLGLCVLPLYAMLPGAAQLRVFDEIKEGERLVIVATNVAETSLTIPGIKYVVDTGREKVKNYNTLTGIETYDVQWISKASAAQRAGRAGRTGPGHCYRLYSSAVFSNILPDFSSAEITKLPVDGVVLIMKSMGIDKVGNFPFPTLPNAAALVEADRCLKALEALDSNGRLTPLGKAMSHYPMSPRHSRMLLTVIQIMKHVKKQYNRANLVLGYAVATAAALSLSNPFIMRFEGSHSNQDDDDILEKNHENFSRKQEKSRKKKLKESRAEFSYPSSDALSVAHVLQCFELSDSPEDFCSEYALHLKTMQEMSKLRKQLLQLIFHQNINEKDFQWTHGGMESVEQAWRVLSSENKKSLLLNEEEILRQAICAGWADRVAKRIRTISSSSEDRKATSARYQACVVEETVFLHRWSCVSNSAPEFLVYSELLHTKRPYMHGATSVKPEWLVRYATSQCSFSAPLPEPKPYYEPQSDQLFCWVTPTFGPHLWKLSLHNLPVSGNDERVMVFGYSLLEGDVLPCLKSVRKFMAAPPVSIFKPEAKSQRRVGNLLFKLKLRSIDSIEKLREIWRVNLMELRPEILDWFQEGFSCHFEAVWSQMLREVVLDPRERFPDSVKRQKRQK